ncbi:MAG: hypothetical protein LBP35_01420 [Candidatus Ancillula trichonymphae]|jgi:predicted Zn-dependent protease|nr:hypothetical protein [Candidatus Ancillula trichonymphae]
MANDEFILVEAQIYDLIDNKCTKLVKAVLQDASLLLKGNTKRICRKYDIIMTPFVTGFFFREILGHVLEDDFYSFHTDLLSKVVKN